jgi:Domain of unknown function (DUF222)
MFDSLVDARRTLDEISVAFDASVLSPQAAERVVDELAWIRNVVDAMIAKTAKRVAETSERDGAARVARSLGVGRGVAQAAIDNAESLEQLPATDAAVREGRLSAGQAQMIAAAATANPAAELDLLEIAERGLVPLRDACVAARAAVEDPDSRAIRQHRQRRFGFWTDDDGMIAGRFRLAPEVGGPIKTVFEAAVQRIFREHKAGTDHEPLAAYAADAFATFVLGDGGAPAKGADATVHVVVDHGALVRGGAVDGEVCEIPGVGPVDVAWVRELIGSAFLTVVIKRGKDILTVAHLGRHIPAEVRTALLVSGRECDVEGCNNRGYLERDHSHDYAKGGPTSFANLGWLCYLHHRLKSSGWILGSRDPVTRKRTLTAPPERVASGASRSRASPMRS